MHIVQQKGRRYVVQSRENKFEMLFKLTAPGQKQNQQGHWFPQTLFVQQYTNQRTIIYEEIHVSAK